MTCNSFVVYYLNIFQQIKMDGWMDLTAMTSPKDK